MVTPRYIQVTGGLVSLVFQHRHFAYVNISLVRVYHFNGRLFGGIYQEVIIDDLKYLLLRAAECFLSRTISRHEDLDSAFFCCHRQVVEVPHLLIDRRHAMIIVIRPFCELLHLNGRYSKKIFLHQIYLKAGADLGNSRGGGGFLEVKPNHY